VRGAAQELGYVPNVFAQRLSNGMPSKTIDLFVTGLDSAVISAQALLLQSKLFEKGYRTPLHGFGYELGTDPRNAEMARLEAVRDMRGHRPAAVVTNFKIWSDETRGEFQKYIDDGGIVVTYGSQEFAGCDHVLLDEGSRRELAIRYFLERGHREIAYSASEALSSSHGLSPLRFQKIMEEFNGVVRPEFLIENGHFEDAGAFLADWFMERGRQGLPRPTAIFIVNDAAASSFVNHLHRRGINVPGDVSVIGYDDMSMARNSLVPLTSVSYPGQVIADSSVELILSRIEKRYSGPARLVEVKAEIVERESVKVASDTPGSLTD
jgi:LacI family transcriptional regulator